MFLPVNRHRPAVELTGEHSDVPVEVSNVFLKKLPRHLKCGAAFNAGAGERAAEDDVRISRVAARCEGGEGGEHERPAPRACQSSSNNGNRSIGARIVAVAVECQ